MKERFVDNRLLSKKLMAWYDIEFCEIPRVLDKMGFANREYMFVIEDVTNALIKIHIQTKDNEYTLTIRQSNFPYWELKNNGKTENFMVMKRLTVQKMA